MGDKDASNINMLSSPREIFLSIASLEKTHPKKTPLK
jgi:hypothetical protein